MRPLVLFANDDGIASPGLWAAAHAFASRDDVDVLIAAPQHQQSGTGRSLPSSSTGALAFQHDRDLPAYAVEGSPAQAVQHGILELAPRRPNLVVSGINYGENTGNGVTISGTVGAALEAASFDIPAIAVSQQTDHSLHLSYSAEVSFEAAAAITLRFGKWILDNTLPFDVDILKIDLPINATLDTPWRITRLSKKRVYSPVVRERVASYDPGAMGYAMTLDPTTAEPDSDVYAVFVDQVVSVTPISLDMTSRIDEDKLYDAFGDA